MSTKVITISMPEEMLRKVDEAAALSYQSRSNFIRMAIVKQFGARDQSDLSRVSEPMLHTDKQLLALYDFDEEYEDAMN